MGGNLFWRVILNKSIKLLITVERDYRQTNELFIINMIRCKQRKVRNRL